MIKLHGKPPNCKFSSIGPTLPLEKEIKLHLCSAQSWLTSLSPSTHHHPHSFLTDCSLSLIKMQRKNDITTRTVQKAYYFGPLIEFRTKNWLVQCQTINRHQPLLCQGLDPTFISSEANTRQKL